MTIRSISRWLAVALYVFFLSFQCNDHLSKYTCFLTYNFDLFSTDELCLQLNELSFAVYEQLREYYSDSGGKKIIAGLISIFPNNVFICAILWIYTLLNHFIQTVVSPHFTSYFKNSKLTRRFTTQKENQNWVWEKQKFNFFWQDTDSTHC